MGKVGIEIAPASTINSEHTVANTGRVMKKFTNIYREPWPLGLEFPCCAFCVPCLGAGGEPPPFAALPCAVCAAVPCCCDPGGGPCIGFTGIPSERNCTADTINCSPGLTPPVTA